MSWFWIIYFGGCLLFFVALFFTFVVTNEDRTWFDFLFCVLLALAWPIIVSTMIANELGIS
jgi:uncharacterized integral membrane protein